MLIPDGFWPAVDVGAHNERRLMNWLQSIADCAKTLLHSKASWLDDVLQDMHAATCLCIVGGTPPDPGRH